MSGHFFLDWAGLALSLFNALLLVWLGLTVLINAERRSWGVFLAGGGLLIGAAFFISHSAILGQGSWALIYRFNFWWRVGWTLVIAAPYAWYLLMLWYGGFWDDQSSALHRRHLPWLGFSILYSLGLAGLLLFASPMLSFSAEVYAEPANALSLSGVPLLILAYPPLILLCIGLALDALLRPAPSGRVMGDLARRRARPWLTSTSLVLLLVSVLIGGLLFWLIQNGRRHPLLSDLIDSLSLQLSWIDLLLVTLIMAAILLLGQALVSYEIFTGKSLPRRGFLRQWHSAIIIAAVFSASAAYLLIGQIHPAYIILVILLQIAFFYALFGWRTFTDREKDVRRLRPFMSSQRLYETILSPEPAPQSEFDLAAPFTALCRDVLGTRQAVLVPSGPLAALSVAPLHYPASLTGKVPPIAGLLAGFDSPQMAGVQLDPGQWEGYQWAAPLWSERGLTGLLLLGEKSDGGFYTLEEIEIARASGERLADLQASAEMARRLMALQRQRLSESQVLDRRARRVLHDDVLPRLHAALLELSSYAKALPGEGQEPLQLLAEAHRRISDLLLELPTAAAPEIGQQGLIRALRKVTEEELAAAFDRAVWQISPEAERRAALLPPLAAEVVYYAAREAIRNAARHARPAGDHRQLHLSVSLDWCDGLEIRIEDNGVGLSFSGPSSPGSGSGLALHSTMMAVINGSLALESAPEEYTRVVLRVPETPG